MNLVLWVAIALGLAAMVVYLVRHEGDRRRALADAPRAKWIFAAVIVWVVGIRALASEVSAICSISVDPRVRVGYSQFLECSPRLLGGGPAEIFTFLWTWLPALFVGAVSARYLLRVARQRLRNHKES